MSPSTWLIEPRDPLIARDGRPASAAQFTTVSFPFPSTTAGAVRTRMAAGRGTFHLAGTALDELKRIPVHGPLLAGLPEGERSEAGEAEGESSAVAAWYAPAPRDVLFVRAAEASVLLHRLLPRPLAPGQQMDSLRDRGLLAVMPAGGLTSGSTAKPPQGLPAFWRWDAFERWLGERASAEPVALAALGIPSLPTEARVHVALQPGERVGLDGALFKTSGLRFLQPDASPDQPPRRFALSVRTSGGVVAGRELDLEEQIAPIGGERRLARWSPAPPWPKLPADVREAIVRDRRARLLLLTPAHFAGGAIPAWSGGAWPLGGPVTATVKAACVPRPEIVSGWDLAFDPGPGKARGGPKPTRRLAPAGSVYFVELSGDSTDDDIGRWCDAAWLAPVSDDEQARLDGFGLAALGAWSQDPRSDEP